MISAPQIALIFCVAAPAEGVKGEVFVKLTSLNIKAIAGCLAYTVSKSQKSVTASGIAYVNMLDHTNGSFVVRDLDILFDATTDSVVPAGNRR